VDIFIKKYMNIFWTLMMLASILVLLITNPSAVLSEMISASTSALNLSIELCAIYAVWLGIIELMQASGLSEKLAKLLRPFIRKVFRVEDERAQELIALNISANMLGIGNASTPMGIRAMQALDDGSGKANFSMIMLIVVNATSIQLLPTTIIGLRQSAGSASASDIILPTILVTIFTTMLGISLVILVDKFAKRCKGAKK
jgi:spore maturation protein A